MNLLVFISVFLIFASLIKLLADQPEYDNMPGAVGPEDEHAA